MKKEFLVIITLAMLFTLSFLSSCSKDDEKQEEDLTSAFIGIWKSIDSESEVLYLELNNDRTGKWLALYNGKIEDTYKIKRWDANEVVFFITRENGENESAPYSAIGDKLLLGEVIYQKTDKFPDLDKLPQNTIELSEKEINILVGEEHDISVSGISINKCNIYSDNKFVSEVFTYNGKLNINGNHVGKANIILEYKEIKDTCKIVISPINDFAGYALIDFNTKRNELKSLIRKPYESLTTNSQTKSVDAYYISTYNITDKYYFNESVLIGIKEEVSSADSDVNTFLNITNSLRERMEYISSENEIIDAYPKIHLTRTIYSYPDKGYAVYEQRKYDILFETGSRPKTRNYIFYAKDLEAAKKHEFSN